MYGFLDGLLIQLYRITGFPLLDYYLGTFLLAGLAVIVGEFTISLVFKANKSHLERLNNRVEKLERLSEEALRRGDPHSYQAVNREGNDAFGHLFFNQFGLSAAYLWPVFLSLAWMRDRFSEVDLPLPWIGWQINYMVFFLLCYIPARILFNRLKGRLPYFRGVRRMLLSEGSPQPKQDS